MRHLSRHANALAQGRVCMYGFADGYGISAHLDGQYDLAKSGCAHRLHTRFSDTAKRSITFEVLQQRHRLVWGFGAGVDGARVGRVVLDVSWQGAYESDAGNVQQLTDLLKTDFGLPFSDHLAD